MGLLPKTERDPATTLVATALSAGMPFAAYLATASPHAYWLDAGEFVESAVELDIAHPPGHPLAALLGHALTFVPLGPLALRVALAQALCAAVAGGFLFSAIDATVRALGVRHDRLSIPLALGATWLATCSHAWWFQAVRPEVYGLQAMLIAIAVERMVKLEAAWPTRDVRGLGTAALAVGLGLANHHFMMVLALPAFAPTAARIYRARGARSLAVAALSVGAGLCAYAYLPVRSGTSPPVDLGHPTTLDAFLWVVSARAYQHADLASTAGPADRLFEVVLSVIENVPWAALVMALAGVWAILRTPGARRIGWIWVALAGFACLGRTWMGHSHGNPDALGYLLPAFMGITALGASLLAAVLGQLVDARRPGIALTAVVWAVAALGLSPLAEARERSSLAHFHATDDFDDLRVRSLPPRAVVLAHLPQTVFRHWELEATEQPRPDVTLVPIPFLGYPGMVEQLLARDPGLTQLLAGYLLEGQLRQADLQSLAAQRPVLVELDARVQPALFETLTPGTFYYEVSDAGTTRAEVTQAVARRRAALAGLDLAIEDDLDDPETRHQRLWAAYMDGLYFARAGAVEPAREAVERGLTLEPEARELRALQARLAAPGAAGAIDITPFLLP